MDSGDDGCDGVEDDLVWAGWEGEAWAMTSPAHPAPVGLQLGQEGWWEVFS